jgi:hypothetical protein
MTFEETELGSVAFTWSRPVPGQSAFVLRDDLDDPMSGTAGPWVVLEGSVIERYAPLRSDRLLADFAELGPLDFANRYGELRTEIVPLRPITGSGAAVMGVPLAGLMGYADDFRDWWRTWQAAKALERDPRDARARRRITSRIARRPGGYVIYRRNPLGLGIEIEESIVHPARADGARLNAALRDDVTAAKWYVAKRVNDQLQGRVSPAVLPLRDSVIRMFPTDLLAAIYYLFAEVIAGRRGTTWLICENCGVEFRGRRDRRTCGSACKAQLWRRRQRDGPPPAARRQRSIGLGVKTS